MKNSWTTPKVKSFPIESGKPWYVWFRFNGILKFVKKGINHIPDYAERLEEAHALASVLEDKLKKGWIPAHTKAIIAKDILSFNDALDFGLEALKPSVSYKTWQDYGCTVRFFKATAKKLKIDKLLISNCERYHVKLIMDNLQQSRSWKNKNYNKHLGYISSVFSELVEWEHIKSNVVRDIRPKKEEKTEGYIQPTDDEKRIIFSHLKETDFHYYIFACIEYYMGIRPKEILSLKCGDVDMENRIIRVPPEDSKNDAYRYVPIFDHVFELLCGFNLSDPDYYLIGRPKPYGCRFFKHEYFCPNPYPIKRATSTRKWKEYVIDGLGIDKKCYSLKHAGANAKLKAGMDMKTISTVFGHSSEKITEIYANHINQIRFQEARNVELESY